MNLLKAHTIYFCGIGGIGMSALAQLLHADAKQILGSDVSASPITQKLVEQGVSIDFSQQGALLTSEVDLFVYTSAIPATHPEYQRAQELGIPLRNYFDAVGEYMQQFKRTIAVSGTHGKSTTTALIANILVNAGLDPTVIVGSVVKEFGSNARKGGKDLFVVEACEHNEHMLKLHPQIIVLTNVEADHLDYYRDLNHIVQSFQTYVDQLPPNGILIKNVDDTASKQLTYKGKTILYGMKSTEHSADITAEQRSVVGTEQHFMSNQTSFILQIPGAFNVSNALAAIALARELQVPESVIQKTLADFGGVWRRFEILGEYREALVISDYAHHPTAVQKTIQAAKEFYPDRRLIAVFQPHQRARTKKLFSEFVAAGIEVPADLFIIREIYDVAGREEKSTSISSQDLVQSMNERGGKVVYAADAEKTRAFLDEQIQPKDVILIMGAGDIYRLAEALTTSS